VGEPPSLRYFESARFYSFSSVVGVAIVIVVLFGDSQGALRDQYDAVAVLVQTVLWSGDMTVG
jgi:hypothetical protein